MEDTRTSPSHDQFPWQPAFHAALLETDPQQLHRKVLEAEEAIVQRMQTLAGTPTPDVERHAMEDAIHALRVIQVEKLNYPPWPSYEK
jgi:hypothetical protein